MNNNVDAISDHEFILMSLSDQSSTISKMSPERINRMSDDVLSRLPDLVQYSAISKLPVERIEAMSNEVLSRLPDLVQYSAISKLPVERIKAMSNEVLFGLNGGGLSAVFEKLPGRADALDNEFLLTLDDSQLRVVLWFVSPQRLDGVSDEIFLKLHLSVDRIAVLEHMSTERIDRLSDEILSSSLRISELRPALLRMSPQRLDRVSDEIFLRMKVPFDRIAVLGHMTTERINRLSNETLSKLRFDELVVAESKMSPERRSRIDNQQKSGNAAKEAEMNKTSDEMPPSRSFDSPR